MDIYQVLSDLDISFDLAEHPPVFTVEQARALERLPEGMDCKNLFLRDRKKQHYFLACFPAQKAVDLKALGTALQVKGLSFASAADLEAMLGLTPGSVTPLGILRDLENRVTVVLDHALMGQKLLVHPNVNTRTISLSCDDLIRFVDAQQHRRIWV